MPRATGATKPAKEKKSRTPRKSRVSDGAQVLLNEIKERKEKLKEQRTVDRVATFLPRLSDWGLDQVADAAIKVKNQRAGLEPSK